MNNKKGLIFGLEGFVFNIWFWLILISIVSYVLLLNAGVSHTFLILIITGFIAGLILNIFINSALFAILGLDIALTAYMELVERVPNLPWNPSIAIFGFSMLVGSAFARFSLLLTGVGT